MDPEIAAIYEASNAVSGKSLNFLSGSLPTPAHDNVPLRFRRHRVL